MDRTAEVELDGDVLGRMIEHLRNDTTDVTTHRMTVPVAHFTCPDRAAQEHALFRRLPLIVGHVSEIADPGDFITREVMGVPLILSRKADGDVAIYRNLCRHRGGRVEMAPAGRKRIFMCTYHGWSYNNENGQLMGVPFEPFFGEVDRQCNSLIRVHAEVRHGLIYATLSDEDRPRSVEAFMGPGLDAQIAPWALDHAILYRDEWIEVDANWKLVMDGATDSLHPQFLHPKPGGVGSRTVTNVVVYKDLGAHGKMFMPRSKLKRMLDAGDQPAADSKYIGSSMMMYPNNMMVESPDHIELWTVWPVMDDTGKCRINIRFLVRPEILTPEMEARINKSWDIVYEAGTEEDFPMEEAIQKNARTWPEGRYQYGRNEVPVQHLHRQLNIDIDGGETGPGTLMFD